MGQKSCRASAPGNLMILGEHAVLHGRRALVCAVSRRMHVRLTARGDRSIRIRSRLGMYEADLDHLRPRPEFRFVLEAVRRERTLLPSGFELDIRSEFPSTIGFGSSAAVTAATCAVLSAWRGEAASRQDIHDRSVGIVRAVQGTGSGADVAASVFGGVVIYRMRPQTIDCLRARPPISVVYSGAKTPTPRVIALVEQARKLHPRLFAAIYDVMDESVPLAVKAIGARDWPALGALLDLNQGLMDAIGVNNPALAEIVFALRAQKGIHGAKISGAGLGDCVLAIGKTAAKRWGRARMDVQVSKEGLRLD